MEDIALLEAMTPRRAVMLAKALQQYNLKQYS